MAITLTTSYQNIWSLTTTYGSAGSVTEILQAKYNSQNVANRTSVVQFRWTYTKTRSSQYDNTNATHRVTYVTSGSTTANDSVSFNMPKGAVVNHERPAVTVTHDADGTYVKNWSVYISHMWDEKAHSGTITGVTLPPIPIDPAIQLKQSGSWIIGKPWIKVNGVWVKGTKVYIKVNGVWEETPLKV